MRVIFKKCYICGEPAFLRPKHVGAICSTCLKISHRHRRWAEWDADPSTIWSDDVYELLLYFKSFAPRLANEFECDNLSEDGSFPIMYSRRYGGDNE